MLAMFNNKSREQLAEIQRQLAEWKDTVSDRARRFHRLCRQLHDDSEHLKARLWISEDAVLSCQQRRDQLKGLVSGLTALLQQAERLQGDLQQLRRDAAEERDMWQWWQERCDQWQGDLERLGVSCERQADLFNDEDKLQRLESELRLHADALGWLKEAGFILNALGSSPDTASLEIELPDWRQRLQASGASQEMVRRLKELCQPLQAKARQPAPPALQDLPRLLADIRGWARGLGAAAGPVRALEQRHRQMAEEWRRREPTEFQALLQEAMDLQKELTEQAYAIRERKRQELEELLYDLERACGPQRDIRQRLDGLKQGPDADYQQHRVWLDKFDKASEYFKAIANTQDFALKQRLRERSDELERTLRDLKDSPLADDARRRVEQLESEIDQLARLQELEDVLRALRQSNDLKRRLDELSQKAEQDKADLTQTQRDLMERNSQLRRQADRTGVEIENLTQEIDNLDAGVDNRTLEQARELALQLQEKLAQTQRLFLERCRALVTERSAAVASIRAALQQLEPERLPATDPPAVTTIPVAAEPAQAAQIVVDWKQSQTQWLQAVEQRLAQYEEQRRQQQAALAQLAPESLDPGDWQTAQQLVARLQSGSGTAETDALEHLQALFGLLQECEVFRRRLSAEQDQLQRRLQQLKQRLQAFRTNNLQAFCPEELFNQLTDLVYGLPAQPQSNHHPQLESAEVLLEQLERHVRRRAAQTVDNAVQELRRRSYAHPDPPAVGALLDRVAALPDEEPAPAALRQQLQDALSQLRR